MKFKISVVGVHRLFLCDGAPVSNKDMVAAWFIKMMFIPSALTNLMLF